MQRPGSDVPSVQPALNVPTISLLFHDIHAASVLLIFQNPRYLRGLQKFLGHFSVSQ